MICQKSIPLFYGFIAANGEKLIDIMNEMYAKAKKSKSKRKTKRNTKNSNRLAEVSSSSDSDEDLRPNRKRQKIAEVISL